MTAADAAADAAELTEQQLRDIGLALRIERVKRQLKQADVAEGAGLDQPTVSNIENGKGRTETVRQLAAYLDVAVPGVA